MMKIVLTRFPWWGWRLFLAGLLGTNGLGVGIWPALGQPGEPASAANSALLAAWEAELTAAIAKCEKSVVAIARVDPQPAPARAPNLANGANPQQPLLLRALDDPDSPDFRPDLFATGIVVDKNGLILTNYHVVGLNSQHWVTTPDRRRYRATIKGADPRSDLAVLEIAATDLTPMPLGDGNALKKGQFAIALGNPYAIAEDGSASAAWGLIANLGRKIPVDQTQPQAGRDKLYHYGMLVQTDAKLNLGTSGGALINLRGEMIGLTTAQAALSGYEQAAGYALPVNETFRRVVETLKAGREVEYGFLGVKPENLTQAERQNLPGDLGQGGVRIAEVVPGTPAERAGVRAGDLLTHIDQQLLRDTDDLVLRMGQFPIETKLPVRLVRNQRPLALAVELTKYPVKGEKIITTPPALWRGMGIDFATALPDDFERVNRLPLFRGGGVAVLHVTPGSPAATAGLQSGMFITAVGEQPIASPREFRAAVAELSGPVQLQTITPAGANTQLEPRTVMEGEAPPDAR